MTEEDIISSILQSKKYKFVCPNTAKRIALWSLSRYKDKQALKEAKNKLHQIYGLYFTSISPEKTKGLLSEITGDKKKDCEVCENILKAHASSEERLPYLKEFYENIFEITGMPKSILDIAAGLNPLTVLWTALPENVCYTALDIDTRLAEIINTFFDKKAMKNSQAYCEDIFCFNNSTHYDVAYVFKTLPCLEQQEKYSSKKLLLSLKADKAVVTFPLKSVSGKNKGMLEYYSSFAEELFSSLGCKYTSFQIENEIVYVAFLSSAHKKSIR